jgi:hypothetical protein
MDEDKNRRVTDVILYPARNAIDDDDGIRTNTSQNETAYGYAETKRKVVATNVLIFRQACDLDEKKIQDRKQLLITNFNKKLNSFAILR